MDQLKIKLDKIFDNFETSLIDVFKLNLDYKEKKKTSARRELTSEKIEPLIQNLNKEILNVLKNDTESINQKNLKIFLIASINNSNKINQLYESLNKEFGIYNKVNSLLNKNNILVPKQYMHYDIDNYIRSINISTFQKDVFDSYSIKLSNTLSQQYVELKDLFKDKLGEFLKSQLKDKNIYNINNYKKLYDFHMTHGDGSKIYDQVKLENVYKDGDTITVKAKLYLEHAKTIYQNDNPTIKIENQEDIKKIAINIVKNELGIMILSGKPVEVKKEMNQILEKLVNLEMIDNRNVNFDLQ